MEGHGIHRIGGVESDDALKVRAGILVPVDIPQVILLQAHGSLMHVPGAGTHFGAAVGDHAVAVVLTDGGRHGLKEEGSLA